ncbi:MAG: hypothetical protein M1835_005086 [Candelina submexicana]|nr:MAG: hypothetical protein M1835_005086 [Candelina submexicana]
MNQQLVNQYNELEDAIESLALDAFSIDDFYPEKAQDFSLLNSLTGLSGIFTIVGGFVPTVGPAIEATGTIASAVGTFLTNSASSNDPLEAQKVFSQKVLTYYRELLSAMEDIVAKLFAGDSIPGPGPGSFNITDMMESGSWVNPNVVVRVSDLNRKIRTEILARSIDSLWKTPTRNKMWVLFKDLQDDASQSKCKIGPQALETFDCAKAAGMQEFQTFWDRCEQVLHHESFIWPDGVTIVNYPDKNGKQVTIRKR